MLLSDLDQIEQFGNALADHILWYAVEFKRKADVFENGSGRQQVEVLKNHTDLPAFARQPGTRQAQEVYTINPYLARGGPLQQVDATDQGAFSGSRRSDNAENLSFRHMERDVGKGVDLLVFLIKRLGDMF